MAFTNGARNAMLWLPAESGRLLGRLIGAPDDAVRTDVPHHPELWGDLCGWYPFTGRLVLRVLTPVPAVYRGFVLHPDDAHDPYVFRIDLSRYGIGTAGSSSPAADQGRRHESSSSCHCGRDGGNRCNRRRTRSGSPSTTRIARSIA